MLYVQFLSITSQSFHDNLCSMLVAQAAGDRNSAFFSFLSITTPQVERNR